MRLTGSPLSDPWSSKGLCHVLTSEPATAVLGRVGFDPEVAPPLADAWERRGAVTAEAAAAFGLPEGVPVSVGWSDAVAAMLAVGAFDAPVGLRPLGDLEHRRHQLRPECFRLIRGYSSCRPRAHPSPSTTARPSRAAPRSSGWPGCCAVTPPRCSLSPLPPSRTKRPVFVPYLSGERAPVWRTDVRAVVLGLGSEHGPAELARAVVGGVCLSEADVLAVAEEHTGSAAGAVAVAGRGAGQAPWREARLAALGRPLHLLADPDASALGAAMLGAAAAAGRARRRPAAARQASKSPRRRRFAPLRGAPVPIPAGCAGQPELAGRRFLFVPTIGQSR